MKEIRFISGNRHKIAEVGEILSDTVKVLPVSLKIEELQTEDVQTLVKMKTLDAFKYLGKPLFVEHTGLYMEGLNGLPAGLTQIFWDKLEADRFVKLANGLSSNRLTAKTVIGYCDGYQLFLFEGQVKGTVPPEPSGNRDFQWDCVFVPDGETKTFAELGAKKNEISMRRIALDRFRAHLQSEA